MPPDDFWRYTPRAVGLISRARMGAIKREDRERDFLAWSTASLVRVAYHDPKKFPDFEKFTRQPTQERRPKTEAELLAIAERWHAVSPQGGQNV